MKLFLTIVCLSMTLTFINGQEIDNCLNEDSISCIQKNIYRKAKELFDKDTIELLSGVTLVKSADNRKSRSSKDVIYDQEINTADNVADRQNILESFVGDGASDFLTGRSLKINFAPAIEKIGQSARAIASSVPEEIHEAVDVVVEGRGKKKIMKTLAPLLMAAKVKVGVLATVAFFAIAFLAKKAIFASFISIAISAFFWLKTLWSKGGDVTAYNAGGFGGSNGWSSSQQAPSNGWSSTGSNGWEDPHSSNSFNAQSQAFSGYHRK